MDIQIINKPIKINKPSSLLLFEIIGASKAVIAHIMKVNIAAIWSENIAAVGCFIFLIILILNSYWRLDRWIRIIILESKILKLESK